MAPETSKKAATSREEALYELGEALARAYAESSGWNYSVSWPPLSAGPIPEPTTEVQLELSL